MPVSVPGGRHILLTTNTTTLHYMEDITPVNVYMAIQLAIEAVAACILVKLKLDEKMPGAPTMSPEEHRELRKQAFDPVVMIPFPEEEEQETK